MSLDTTSRSASVWPGYVAAVSSLVLSLLLLAGVLVVSISQAGRVVENYNNQLIESVIQSELQKLELEQLQSKAPSLSGLSVAPAVQPAQAKPKPKPTEVDRQARSFVDVQAALQEKTSELNKSQEELFSLRSQIQAAESLVKEVVAIKSYRLIFTADSEAMDKSMLAQLRQQVLRDGVLNINERWQLETGTKGLDAVAEREAYRLMLSVRSQLLSLGIEADQVKLVINRERSAQELPSNKAGQIKGDLAMTLRRDFSKVSR